MAVISRIRSFDFSNVNIKLIYEIETTRFTQRYMKVTNGSIHSLLILKNILSGSFGQQ